MDAIRKIVKVNDDNITIAVPSSYRSKKVEVIVLEYEDKKQEMQRSFYFGCLKDKIEIKDDFNEIPEDFKEYV